MRFIDECTLRIEAGDGGNGSVAFRREKFIPLGGPSGGDGGRGGDVSLVAAPGMNTLLDLQHLQAIRAESGRNGQGKDCYGRSGSSKEIRVPLGTIVEDLDTQEILGEITHDGQTLLIARGGRGGRGNIHFATPTDRAPRRAEDGKLGKKRNLRLQLKVMADVGLLGFPNVGKSTLISTVSRARPKVADYPFTTLIPQLGVVKIPGGTDEKTESFVLADIPGLIEGASQGAGLGIRFLKHVERTRLLLHLVTVAPEPERSPISDYQALRRELEAFDANLAARPEIVVMTQADRPEVREAHAQLKAAFEQLGVELFLISSVTHEQLDPLLQHIGRTLATLERPTPSSTDSEPPESSEAQAKKIDLDI